MGKSGKLSKLRCLIKRWNSSSRFHCAGGYYNSAPEVEDLWHTESFNGDKVPEGFHPVYVGQSRRRFIVSSELVNHPRFKNLVEGSSYGATVVACEVVLFEHLLWMLEHAEPRPELLDDLVDFYAS